LFRILVIEDHPALGRFVRAALQDVGWVVVGPIADHASAMQAARHLTFDLALLDRMLRGQETFAVADALATRGGPCVLMSGYPRSTLPARFRDWPFLEKPFSAEALVCAARDALGGGASSV
jgi:DNA-binding response OmpR family regulator